MRERYINDPDVLLSVEYNTNSSQRRLWARSVEAPTEAEWCGYVKRWIQTKTKYDLRVSVP